MILLSTDVCVKHTYVITIYTGCLIIIIGVHSQKYEERIELNRKVLYCFAKISYENELLINKDLWQHAFARFGEKSRPVFTIATQRGIASLGEALINNND